MRHPALSGHTLRELLAGMTGGGWPAHDRSSGSVSQGDAASRRRARPGRRRPGRPPHRHRARPPERRPLQYPAQQSPATLADAALKRLLAARGTRRRGLPPPVRRSRHVPGRRRSCRAVQTRWPNSISACPARHDPLRYQSDRRKPPAQHAADVDVDREHRLLARKAAHRRSDVGPDAGECPEVLGASRTRRRSARSGAGRGRGGDSRAPAIGRARRPAKPRPAPQPWPSARSSAPKRRPRDSRWSAPTSPRRPRRRKRRGASATAAAERGRPTSRAPPPLPDRSRSRPAR